MVNLRKVFVRVIALLLAFALLAPCSLSVQSAYAASEEEIDLTGVTHTAVSTVALKVRRSPDQSSTGGDSIPRGNMVYILEYGALWCQVRTKHLDGWVMTKYLTDIHPVEGYEAPEKDESPKEAVGEVQPGFTMNASNFYEGYYAHTVVNNAGIYEQPTEGSRRIKAVEIYQQVIVGEISGDWCFARYNGNVYGFMRVKDLFKWDRIDPYIGEIPGLDVWPYLIFTNKVTDVLDSKGKVLQTINPGSAVCAGEKDALGRYPVPYDRVTGYINEADVSYVMPVKNWEEAESGDLISTMTTFFAVGVSTLQYQGRNWNIHLASGMISGTVLQPGQEFNMNETIGPYRKSTGYKSAPILSPHALSGYGGGTCQVNTTFYITTIQLPLLVKHRKVHADVGMYYCKQGFDAAVGGGNINLIMENTLPYPIRYVFMNSDGVLTCCIFKE